MAQFVPLFDMDVQNSRHVFKRAQGQLAKGPIQRDGYVNNTKQTTNQETFASESIEIKRPVGSNYATKNKLMNARKVKMVSRGDDF
jgi:hypothetical protein